MSLYVTCCYVPVTSCMMTCMMHVSTSLRTLHSRTCTGCICSMCYLHAFVRFGRATQRRTHTYIRTYTHIHGHIHACMHTYKLACTHAYVIYIRRSNTTFISSLFTALSGRAARLHTYYIQMLAPSHRAQVLIIARVRALARGFYARLGHLARAAGWSCASGEAHYLTFVIRLLSFSRGHPPVCLQLHGAGSYCTQHEVLHFVCDFLARPINL